MKTSNFGLYALRLGIGQTSHLSSQASNSVVRSATSPDRLVMRSATMLAVLGIALSSFSLKQMLTNGSNKPISMQIRKF